MPVGILSRTVFHGLSSSLCASKKRLKLK